MIETPETDIERRPQCRARSPRNMLFEVIQ